MFPQLGMMEMVVVMGVAVLLFGKRLPEVGRSLGKGIVEFKKGLRGMEDGFDINSTSSSHVPAHRYDDTHRVDDRVETSIPKFEPPTSAPIPRMGHDPQSTQD